jgi:hypothetical protein
MKQLDHLRYTVLYYYIILLNPAHDEKIGTHPQSVSLTYHLLNQ